jgi:hypothetical protein
MVVGSGQEGMADDGARRDHGRGRLRRVLLARAFRAPNGRCFVAGQTCVSSAVVEGRW